MTSNLINIGQLLAKGYNMKLKENQMKVCNGKVRMILKAPLLDNKTFKIEIYMVDDTFLLYLRLSTPYTHSNSICL